jgi:hypothetical protein
MPHAIVIPPGGGVPFGNVEFLGLSEHSPRMNVSIITMAPGRSGPDSHVHDAEDDAFYVLDGELTFLLGEEDVAAGPRPQHPRPSGLRSPSDGRLTQLLFHSMSAVMSDLQLEDARESLAYWEDRARRLPRYAIRRRREAREMAARWHVRVAEAERAVYGRGLLGALLLLAAERRLPESTRRAGRRLARRTAQAAVLICVATIALIVTGMVAVIELLAEVVRAAA